MSVHIGKLCSKAFYGLYKVRHIWKFLSPETTKTLVHAFVSSHLDHYNSLQKMLNAAARLIVGLSKFDHISSALYDLHWLPVIYRVQFKLLLLLFLVYFFFCYFLFLSFCLQIKDVLHINTTTTYRLRSQHHNLFSEPNTGHLVIVRLHPHSGLFLWNKLPREMRQVQFWPGCF